MKTFALLALTLLPLAAGAGNIQNILADQGIDADAKTFLPGVTWNDNPAEAHYRCTGRGGSHTGDILRGPTSQVKTIRSPKETVRYGEHGPIKVFAYTDGKRAVYLILPSGETHLFRFSEEQEIVKSSMEWQCEQQPPSQQPAAERQ